MKRLEKAWAAFTESYAGLSDADLLEPGVSGDWSVRDIIAHVTWWEEEALAHLPHILEGKKPPKYSVTYGGIDAFNAQMTVLRRHASLAEVLRRQADTHRRLVDFVAGAPDDQLVRETRFRHRLRRDTHGHYRIHTEDIRRWREQRSARPR